MRELKHHEQKLLKKVDLFTYKSENNHRDLAVIRRYHIQNREDYFKYNKIAGSMKHMAHRLSLLSAEDGFRRRQESLLLDKAFAMGLVPSATKLSDINGLSVSAFCRRRLPIVMCRLKMCQLVSQAVTYIEQGHVRVGPEVVTDPAYLVNRSLEDYVTWVDSSKIKRKIATYNDKLDDYDLMQV
ncbi:U3 small nucleolar ribonucleoprotein protein imp3 [Taphrina deformans PYCC 5710]|uniref:U3 small nucleolar ribonucleoprotein protein IMP3 n=1 Tax=Taphrina deformans (strain PYCC 5710 / ATCC 11124 / CBS 356.35 / IMI 108563 / JCM 9778 / NBRC 8474) TaxID=1097556 RepID=R4XDE9_TAPDE|nr:U3 small nucleolar ribonucleoprotein protein imp3 [Taphrina deformans PYCC 5710]|eukprot:CCG82433.1 U3 small nucleolar ribonucleoprotein protein imp3 [Taphrina deformans PYCC 5710]